MWTLSTLTLMLRSNQQCSSPNVPQGFVPLPSFLFFHWCLVLYHCCRWCLVCKLLFFLHCGQYRLGQANLTSEFENPNCLDPGRFISTLDNSQYFIPHQLCISLVSHPTDLQALCDLLCKNYDAQRQSDGSISIYFS